MMQSTYFYETMMQDRARETETRVRHRQLLTLAQEAKAAQHPGIECREQGRESVEMSGAWLDVLHSLLARMRFGAAA